MSVRSPFPARPRDKQHSHTCFLVAEGAAAICRGTIFTKGVGSCCSKPPTSCGTVLCTRLEPFKLSFPLSAGEGEGGNSQGEQDRYHLKQILIKHLGDCCIRSCPRKWFARDMRIELSSVWTSELAQFCLRVISQELCYSKYVSRTSNVNVAWELVRLPQPRSLPDLHQPGVY